MGTRKTTLEAVILQWVEPNSIVGILQDDPEVDIRYMPGAYVEWHSARRETVGIREIKLLDLLRWSLRKNYRKIIIAEVRSPEEIYSYIELLKVTYGALTTIHALSIQTLEQRLLSGRLEDQTVDRTDLETIRLAVINGFVDRRPKVLYVYFTDFINRKFEELAHFERGEWVINENTLNHYFNELANINNMPVEKVEEIYNVIYFILDVLSKNKIAIKPNDLRSIWLEYWRKGYEGVKTGISNLLHGG